MEAEVWEEKRIRRVQAELLALKGNRHWKKKGVWVKPLGGKEKPTRQLRGARGGKTRQKKRSGNLSSPGRKGGG